MTPLTLEWVNKAEGDFQAMQWLRQAPAAPCEAVGFHAQQCIEKYMKATLQEADIAFPKTRDLEMLLGLLTTADDKWTERRADVAFLSRFAVEVRYPGVATTEDEAEEAASLCETLRDVIRQGLGLPAEDGGGQA
jgi:HEPN domain-containing protein